MGPTVSFMTEQLEIVALEGMADVGGHAIPGHTDHIGLVRTPMRSGGPAGAMGPYGTAPHMVPRPHLPLVVGEEFRIRADGALCVPWHVDVARPRQLEP